MQVALVLLAVVGSTAWLAVDAAKRDWADNGFAKNVPTWVAGSLLLWPVVFPMYVFAHRKKAPLKNPPAPEPQPAVAPRPAAAMAGPAPSEQYGPSIEEIEVAPEPVVEIEPTPDPVVEFGPTPDPVVEIEPTPDPVVEFEPAPEAEPVATMQPEPVVQVEPEPALEVHPEPIVEQVSEVEAPPAIEVEPEPIVDAEAEPVIELKFHDGEEPVFDISRPAAEAQPEPITPVAADQAPPGLSVDAFKDIKPVAFGGFAGSDDDEEQPESAPEPVAEAAPETATEIAEPVVELEPQPLDDITPEPVGDFELAHPKLDVEPVFEMEPEPYDPQPFELEPLPEPEPFEPAAAAEAQDTEPAPAKKRGRFNPEIKLPSFGRNKAKVAAASAAEPKQKRGLKLPGPQLKLPKLSLSRKPRDASAKKSFVTLPANLQGPLNDLERKIALGSVVAVVAAAGIGYMSAPSEGSASPAPPPAPTATSR